MIIEGERVLLTPEEKDDSVIVFKWFNDKEILDSIVGFRPCFTTEDALKWSTCASDFKTIKWIIRSKDSREPLGFTGLYNIDFVNRSAESAIVIGDKQFRGKGFAKETIVLVSNFSFDYLNLKIIYAWIISSNEPSLKLYKSLGFEEQGILRKRILRNANWLDLVYVALENKKGV